MGTDTEAAEFQRRLISLSVLLSAPGVLVSSVVVGVLAGSAGWALLTFVLTGAVAMAGCALTLAALKDRPPMARHLFRLVFGQRRLMRLLLLQHPPRH